MKFPLRVNGYGSERPGRVSADNTYVDTLRVPVLYRTVGEQLNVFASQTEAVGRSGKFARFGAPGDSRNGAPSNGTLKRSVAVARGPAEAGPSMRRAAESGP